MSASLRCDGHDNCLDNSDEVCPPAKPFHKAHRNCEVQSVKLHLAQCSHVKMWDVYLKRNLGAAPYRLCITARWLCIVYSIERERKAQITIYA